MLIMKWQCDQNFLLRSPAIAGLFFTLMPFVVNKQITKQKKRFWQTLRYEEFPIVVGRRGNYILVRPSRN